MPNPEHHNLQTPELSREEEIRSIKEELSDIKEKAQEMIEEARRNYSAPIEPIKELMEKAKKLKRRLNQLESNFDTEQYLTDIYPFMLDIYKNYWEYTEDQLKIVSEVISNPDNIHIGEPIPFDTLKKQNENDTTREANKKKTGEIYLSSETPDFEHSGVFIPSIPEDIKEKGVSGVLEYIHKTYADDPKYIIPDIKYYQYLIDLGDKHKSETDEKKKAEILKQIPEQLRDGNYYFFPGSAFVRGSGRWYAPRSRWVGGGFNRVANRLDFGWGSGYRVVLLER